VPEGAVRARVEVRAELLDQRREAIVGEQEEHVAETVFVDLLDQAVVVRHVDAPAHDAGGVVGEREVGRLAWVVEREDGVALRREVREEGCVHEGVHAATGAEDEGGPVAHVLCFGRGEDGCLPL